MATNNKTVVNPRWWGATGDGTTNDTPAIQYALDTEMDVFLPPGNYAVTTLTLKANDQSFFGVGQRSRLSKSNGTGNLIYIGDSLANNHIRDMYLTIVQGVAQTTSVGIYYDSTALTGLRLRNLFIGNLDTGIALYEGMVDLSDVLIETCVTYGLYISGSLSNYFTNLKIGTTPRSLYLSLSHYNQFSNLIIEGATASAGYGAINLSRSYSNQFANVHLSQPAGNGIYIDSSGFNRFSNVTIRDPSFQNNGTYDGIVITDTYSAAVGRNVFSNVYFRDTNPALKYTRRGFNIASGCNQNVISDCVLNVISTSSSGNVSLYDLSMSSVYRNVTTTPEWLTAHTLINCEGVTVGGAETDWFSQAASFVTNGATGMSVYNYTDGSTGIVTNNSSATVCWTALQGGTNNKWTVGDSWQIGPGPSQSGHVFYCGTATTMRLPDVSLLTDAYEVTIYVTGAVVVSIDPQDGDRIRLAGTALTDGNEIDSPGTAGAFVTLRKESSDGWVVTNLSGAWIDGGAS